MYGLYFLPAMQSNSHVQSITLLETLCNLGLIHSKPAVRVTHRCGEMSWKDLGIPGFGDAEGKGSRASPPQMPEPKVLFSSWQQ